MNLYKKKFILQPNLLAFIFSLFALLMALYLQYILNYYPCHLCIMQRYGYGITLTLGLIGLYFKNQNIIPILICLSLLYTISIAFWHIGIESQWWAASLECSGMIENIGSLKEELENTLKSGPTAACDQVSPKTLEITLVQWSFIYGLVSFIIVTILTIKQIIKR